MFARKISLLFLFLSGLMFLSVSAQAANKSCYNKNAKGLVSKVSNNMCVMNKAGSKWVPAVKSGTCYTEKKRKVKAAHKTACKSLLGGQLKKLGQLPSAAKIARASQSGSSSSSVSGEPPVLSDIPDMDVTTLFWREGVVNGILSGSPSIQQCGEFFSSQVDGESGGLNACNLAAGVGHSFEPLLRAGGSACYMKNAPTRANVEAGALELVSGSLPGNDPAKLFTPNASKDRLVKMLVANSFGEGTQNIFIKIFSNASNLSKGYRYRYQLWFCDSDEETANSYEETRVSMDGKYYALNKGMDDYGTFSAELNAYLASEGGEIVFDTDRSRTADVVFEQPGGGKFKSRLSINSDNEIRNQMYDVSGWTRKAYSVSNFSGSSISDLKFLQGAYKDIQYQGSTPSGSFSGATEFRDTYYASAPENAYLLDLEEVDLNSGKFFTSEPDVEFNGDAFSCAADADIVLSMDMEHEAMLPIASLCEGERMDGMNFCWDNESVQNAMEGAYMHCSYGPPS